MFFVYNEENKPFIINIKIMSTFKRIFVGILVATFAISGSFLAPARAAEEVCGVDGITYADEQASLAADVEVSYEGACQAVTNEAGLSEEQMAVNFAGVLIEIGTTDIPTTIIVEDNESKTHYTIEVTDDTVLGQRQYGYTKLSDWIPGDQVRVWGSLNENTNTVTARELVNLSFLPKRFRGINGWITDIDKEDSTITYTWMQKERDVRITDRTRIVAGLKNPASIDDLAVGDRIRGRTFASDDEAKIIVVLRRGRDLFMKIRTFVPKAELVRLNSTVVPTTIQVKILPTPSLRANDVNNLIGTAGKLVTVNITEDTVLVRKYFGRATLAEFTPGDRLHIVGRANDDGTVDAKLIKNESIWRTQIFGHVGTVIAINAAEGYFEMNWVPIRYFPHVKLKQKIEERAESLEAQAVPGAKMDSLTDRLQERIRKKLKEAKAKVDTMRKTVVKRVKSSRIKKAGVRLRDVIRPLDAKKMRINISSTTVIRIGDNDQATLDDLSVGDRVIVRGIRHARLPLIEARKVVVMPSLPELEEDLDTLLDDVNEVVEEIVSVDDEPNSGATETEEVVESDD